VSDITYSEVPLFSTSIFISIPLSFTPHLAVSFAHSGQCVSCVQKCNSLQIQFEKLYKANLCTISIKMAGRESQILYYICTSHSIEWGIEAADANGERFFVPTMAIFSDMKISKFFFDLPLLLGSSRIWQDNPPPAHFGNCCQDCLDFQIKK